MIRVLIVEDSPTHQQLLRQILESDPQIEVMAIVGDGVEAVEFAGKNRPDLILMDIHMPRMNGFEATEQIMKIQPVPIIIISSSSLSRDMDCMFKAIAAGALTFQNKPHGPGHPNFEEEAVKLIQSVKTLAEVKVIRRYFNPIKAASARIPAAARPSGDLKEIKLVAVGASTGGPPALQHFLLNLPPGLPVPVVVVQHIASGFLRGLVTWLADTTGHHVRMAASEEIPQPGIIYFAPEGKHLEINGAGKMILLDGGLEYGVKPAVARLFRSVAMVYGPRAVGILLTGMGCDGAEELRLMRQKGALTFAQNKESSVVHGMPGEAIRLDAAAYVLPPDKIAEYLVNIILRQNQATKAGGQESWTNRSTS